MEISRENTGLLGELDTAGLHFDEAAARPDEVGEFGAFAVEADAVFGV
jgi:hypothetical protein